MIVVIDYGAGNLRSVVNALEAIDQRVCVTNNPNDLQQASAIILPGVGAFGDSMQMMRQYNLIEELCDQVLVNKKPFLGICLGLQFMGTRSDEYGDHEGFGWLNAGIKRLTPNSPAFRVPHIGWNNIDIVGASPLLETLEARSVFYFVHSYHLVPDDAAATSAVTSTCWHGQQVVASVQKDNMFAVQFHPEKSQQNGLTVLRNFVKLI
jgi:glutamine amidotransferase